MLKAITFEYDDEFKSKLTIDIISNRKLISSNSDVWINDISDRLKQIKNNNPSKDNPDYDRIKLLNKRNMISTLVELISNVDL